MKDKSKVGLSFKKIYNMIQTQFHAKIQVLKTNNARDYFNSILGEFLLREGIVHQSSYIDTPQQYEISKRKIKHLLEVARAVMFSSYVLKNLWGAVVLTATYLINRMSSYILSF